MDVNDERLTDGLMLKYTVIMAYGLGRWYNKVFSWFNAHFTTGHASPVWAPLEAAWWQGQWTPQLLASDTFDFVEIMQYCNCFCKQLLMHLMIWLAEVCHAGDFRIVLKRKKRHLWIFCFLDKCAVCSKYTVNITYIKVFCFFSSQIKLV